MKKLIAVIISLTICIGASAQHFYHGYGYAPRVIVTGGFYGGPYYPYYGPYYPYPYYNPYYGYRPTKLDLQISDIKNEYSEKISAARHDNSLSHKERRAEVRRLKNEREQAIADAKRNYYRH